MELHTVFICVLISLFDTESEASRQQENVGKPSLLMPSVCRKDANGTSLSVEIRLPFMDMELHHEGRLHVLQAEQLLLVLHGHEVFHWQIASQERRLVRLGELGGRARQQISLAAAIVIWQEYILLAVALAESLEVYQLPADALQQSRQWHFEPIQEFTTPGRLQQMHLLKANQDQVLLLLTLNHTQSQGKLKTFEWLETYFNPVEELSLPAIKAFQVVGRQPHYIITGRSLRSQSKLVLTVYELEIPSLRLQRRQSLTVQARHVLATRFRGRNCLIACSDSSVNSISGCILFRMIDGSFVVYRKHMLQQLHFSHLAASRLGQLLVGARANGEVLVFNSHRLDCYSGFAADPHPSGLFTHRNALNETFLLLVHQPQPGATLLRLVQLGRTNVAATLGASLEGNDDLSSVQQHRHEFEESVNALRSVLLRHKQQLAAVHRLSRLLQQQQSNKTLNLEQPLHMRSPGQIEQVRMQGNHLRTPTQLQQRMEQLRQHYVSVKRPVRSFGVGNASNTSDKELLRVRILHVKNLVYHGQLLPDYYLDSTGAPILTIKGQLATKRLHAQKLLTPPGYKRALRSVDKIQQNEHIVVQHLHVARINNVTWFDFYDSLFLPSRDKQIEGRLIVQSRARVVNLETPLLNGLVVRQLFNLRQPQVVASNIFMSGFFVSKLEAKLINGLNFAQDIVFRDTNDPLIKTPVRIDEMSISRDLIVANDSAKHQKRQLSEEEEAASPGHRLQQYYTARVTLNGSLTVNNLQRDTNATRLQLGDQSLRHEDLHSDYLLLHAAQNLDTLAFGNAKVTAPSLNSAHIGGHPVDQHLLSGFNQPLVETFKPLHIIFMDARVQGDIKCHNYSSRLAELSKEAVRQGEAAIITGHKQFEAPLTVETLSSQSLNGIKTNELVLKSETVQNFTNLKRFKRIVVKNNVHIDGNLVAETLNRLPIAQLLDRGYSLQRLELLEKPKLQQLNFQRLNGLAFDELLDMSSDGNNNNSKQLLLRKQLIIQGNVRFEDELQLQTLNDLHWDEYTTRLVKANANSEISGCKHFHEPVLLTDALQMPSINGQDLSALLDNTLLRTTPQSIDGSYTFDRLLVGNLDVPGVNGVPASSFLDTRQHEVHLQGDLHVNQLSINGSLNCALSNDPLANLDAQLAQLQQRPWSKLNVLGDALWPEQTYTRLDYLRQHAVRRGNRGNSTQTIAGHVILHAAHLGSIQSLHHPIFGGNLNLSFIASDAVLRNTTGIQLIESPQELLQPVRARAVSLIKDCQFGQLNHIDLVRLNASLYRRSSQLPIKGRLSFVTPPIVDTMLVQGAVNGGNLQAVFQQAKDADWPAVRLQQLQLQGQLQLGDINGMNLEYLLQQRVPLRGATALELFGTLTFEDLVLGDRAMLRTINGIPLQSVVYKQAAQLQSIMGTKTFEKGIDLLGPVHIMRLNGKDLSESYQQSIFTDRDYNIDSLVLDGALFQADLLPEPRAADVELPPGQQLREQLQQLEQQLRSSQSNHSKRLLYLDYEQQSFEAAWSAPASDQAARFDFETAIQPEPSSVCQLQELRAQLSRAEQRVYLANVSLSSRPIRAHSRHGEIHVKAQNYCNKSKFRGRIHISCRGLLHTLATRQHVEDLQLQELTHYSLLLISTMEEVRVLRVDHSNCSLSDWQSIQPAAGRVMRLIQLDPQTLLLFSGALHQHLPAVAVHRLSLDTERFELLQLIAGDYDLVDVQDQQLLLSCHRCRRIDVHVYRTLQQRFVPLQQLRLEARIQQLLPFTVGTERHLLVLTMSGSRNFYLLSYAHIEGWQQRTYGHLGEVLWSWPLLRPGAALTTSSSIMLLCGQQHCGLVRALIA